MGTGANRFVAMLVYCAITILDNVNCCLGLFHKLLFSAAWHPYFIDGETEGYRDHSTMRWWKTLAHKPPAHMVRELRVVFIRFNGWR